MAIVQDGARGHYGLAAALQRAGVLERVYTDWYAPPGSAAAGVSKVVRLAAPRLGQNMLDRHSEHLDASRVESSAPLMFRLQLGRSRHPSAADYYAWASAITGRWVLRRGFAEANVLLGFIRNIDPDLCRVARQRGLVTVGDQMIAPAATEMREMQLQQQRWPGWETGDVESAAFYQAIDRQERRTWEQLDHMICPSDYVKQEMVRHGVDGSRVSVVHYAVDDSVFTFEDRGGRRGPLVVGFAGSVGLR
ncbi:MAG: glycosyltransferase, partial [Tepidisphaeraceae bacterium]